MPTLISTFIIARNEADRIGPTIDAAWAVSQEIVVVDSGSSDDTAAIARAKGARVVENAWPGYGPQKRFAETLCQNDWVLNVDADEVLSADLAREIAGLAENDRLAKDAYAIAIAEVYPGETEPASFAYVLRPVRLYRRSKGSYANSTVHDRVELAPGARVGRLKGRINHYSVRSLRDEIGKLLRYADQQADAAENKQRRISTLRLIGEFPIAFLKAYFLRRHFLRGAYGYAISINYAFYRHIRIVQLYERHRNAAPK